MKKILFLFSTIALQANHFVTFENPDSIKAKVDYAKSHNLKGVMAWHIGLDRTGHLIEAISESLPQDKESVVYFFNHMTNRGKNATIVDIQKLLEQNQKITTLIYCFLKPNSDGTVEYDSGRFDSKNLEQLKQLKKRFPRVKLLFSIGGWSYQKIFFEVAQNKQLKRLAFNTIKQLGNLFDGVDIDWEFHASEFEQFKREYPKFVNYVLQAIQAGGTRKIVTLALPHNARFYRNFPELADLSKNVDWINLMSYNYEGPHWSEVTGHNAPLYSPQPEHRRRWKKEHPKFESVDTTVQAFLQAGIKPQKLVLGIPFYGRSFAGVKPGKNKDGLYEIHKGPSEVLSPVLGTVTYAGLIERNAPVAHDHDKESDFTYYWDDQCKVPYLYSKN